MEWKHIGWRRSRVNIAILLAGGMGTRMGTNTPKQHLIVAKHQVIEYTLTSFCYNEAIDSVMVVSNPEYIEEVSKFKAEFGKLKWVVPGGTTRIHSVYNAIKTIDDSGCNVNKVVIHDAVRPCVTFSEVREVLQKLDKFVAVTTCVDLYESVLKVVNNTIEEIIPKDCLVRQTSPEGFQYEILKKLYLETPIETIETYKNIGIDQLIAMGRTVGLVNSNPLNFKITTPADIFFFDTVLKKGFDTILNGDVHVE